MRNKILRVISLVSILVGIVGVIPVAAQDPTPVDPEPIDVGPEIRMGELDFEGEPELPPLGRRAEGMDYVEGDVVTWMGLNSYTGYYYFKDYELMAVGVHGEVWVATELAWPEGDPRDTPVVTQDQIDYLLDEFDNNIYPVEEEFFGTPDEHDGSNALLAAWGYVPEGYYDGDKVVILIDNVRDDNYYDPTYPFYIAGFYSPSFEAYFDRNVMSIDAYDWENRVGPDGSRPYLYEGVFAHEFQHLIHDDNDPDEELWVNEGMSMFAEWLCGYVAGEDQFDYFLEHAENSLVMWGDQEGSSTNVSEILADYGIVYLWTLYLYEHFGGGPFVQALATSESHGIAGVEEQLAAFGYDATFADVFHDFRIACLIDSPMAFKLPFFPWSKFGRGMDWVHPYEFENADVHVNVDTFEAWGEPGAPPWGTDYIMITDESFFKMIKFNGDDEAVFPTPWTVVEDPMDPTNEVLWSGTGDLLDNWAIFEATGGGVLQFDTLFDLEDYWDFGFVQVSTDDGATWTSLVDNEGYSTDVYDPSAHPTVVENVPGLTSYVTETVTLSYDLSPYVGQDILIALRFVTDWATHYGGWWVDNIYVDATEISDGSSTDPFMDITEINPIELDFSVTLVGVYERHGKQHFIVRDMYIDDLDEQGAGFLAGIVRLGGYAVLMVSLEVPEEDAYFYGPYEYNIEYPWE